MSLPTYSEFQALDASEKIGLAIVEAAKQLVGWTLYSGSIYSIAFEYPSIVQIADTGVALTEAASVGGVTAGKWYHDRANRMLYVRTSDSVNPSGKFLTARFRLFFSNVAVTAPHDLANGFEVEWVPLMDPASEFSIDIDNVNQLGTTIEGSGRLSLYNDKTFWSPIYDNLTFENQNVLVYSWNRELPISQAKILFRGKIQSKSYSTDTVTFGLKDLSVAMRAPLQTEIMSSVSNARIPESFYNLPQRKIYGHVRGLRPINIDQTLEGWEQPGTLNFTYGSDTVTNTVTSLGEISSGDKIYAQIIDTDTGELKFTREYEVEEAGAFSQVLSEPWEDYTGSTTTWYVKPSYPRVLRNDGMNRIFFVAGHPIARPSTTITEVYSANFMRVADSSIFFVGGQIEINGEARTLDRCENNIIRLTVGLTSLPGIGDDVHLSAIQKVYLNDVLLTPFDDYTYDPDAATITLDDFAEYNNTADSVLSGSCSFTSASFVVTGTGTAFTKQLKPGDWVLAPGGANYREVWYIVDDTEFVMTGTPGVTASGTTNYKSVDYYDEGKSVISCDVIGITEDGTSSGRPIYSAPEIVLKILTDAGLDDSLNLASFAEASELLPHRIGIAFPEKYSDTSSVTIRDAINIINKSVMGLLHSDQDMLLRYSAISPARPSTLISLSEFDIQSLSISSDSGKIASSVVVEYQAKEHEPLSGAPAFYTAEKSSDTSNYLSRTEKEFRVRTALSEESSAQIMANRFALVLERATSIIKCRTKLKAIRSELLEPVLVNHEKVYERIGTAIAGKVAFVTAISKSVSSVNLELDDLSNTFSRCASITDSDAADVSDASSVEVLLNGYITDSYGLTEGNQNTHGTNLIW